MKTTNSIPAKTRAIAFLEKCITKYADRPGTRLPSIRQCAQEAGVSAMSMHAAVRILLKKGTIAVKNRSGIIIPGDFVDKRESPMEPRRLGSERLKEQLTRDIISGIYKPNQPLPAVKELRRRTGHCYQVISRTLRQLVSSGVTVASGRNYIVRPHERSSLSSVYIFMEEQFLQAHRETLEERKFEFLRMTEIECHNRNLDLKFAGFTNRSSELKRVLSNSTLGVIVWASEDPAANRTLVDFLSQFNCKVVIINEHTTDALTPVPLTLRNKLKQFSFSLSTRAGFDVGMYLLQKKHRNVVSISYHQDKNFSRARQTGLIEAFTSAGFPGGVQSCLRLVPHEQIDNAKDRHLTPEKSITFTPDFKNLTSIVSRMKSKNRSIHNAHLLEYALDNMVLREKSAGICRPLFEEALAHEDATAWVCVHDNMALSAQDFLNEQMKRRGRKIALISFDDSFAAFEQDISSYNFNLPILVAKALSFFTHPEAGRKAGGVGVEEVQGHVMERKSTG